MSDMTGYGNVTGPKTAAWFCISCNGTFWLRPGEQHRCEPAANLPSSNSGDTSRTLRQLLIAGVIAERGNRGTVGDLALAIDRMLDELEAA